MYLSRFLHSHGRKDFLHYVKGLLWPAVLVHHSFIVITAGTCREPFLLSYFTIRELPDKDSCQSFILFVDLQIFLNQVSLTFFAPLTSAPVPEPVDRTCSKLADDHRLPGASGLVYPIHLLVVSLQHRYILIPAGIHVKRYNIRQIQANICEMSAGGRGGGP